MRTLFVRVQAQNAGAGAVADFLAGHPRVAKVNYPDRTTGSRAEIVARQMSGGGGILSFVVDGDAAQTAAMVDRLRLISLAASLGGVESLACQPALLTHRSLTPDERKRRGIDDSMVRLSVGWRIPQISWLTSMARSHERSVRLRLRRSYSLPPTGRDHVEAPALVAHDHTHAWQTRSTHHTLEGLVRYQHCKCGQWRVTLATGIAAEIGNTRGPGRDRGR